MPPNTVDPRDVRIAMLEQELKVTQLACERAEYRLADLLRRIYGPKSDKIDSG